MKKRFLKLFIKEKCYKCSTGKLRFSFYAERGKIYECDNCHAIAK